MTQSSMTQYQTAQLSLEQRRAIDRQKEKLVPAAEQFLDESNVVGMKAKDFGHSQLRNLIAIANETESPAVVLNFVRYQMGRDTRGNSWRYAAGGKSLGDRLLDEFGKDGAIAGALQEIGDLEGAQRQLAEITMMRQYLGFASRYLKYIDLKR